ncbi:MAG TPA: serine hydrolase domain-containing protein, partial [Pyrinomonadaceae bacterium]|nr:serine hydrolase domain-containing protein [Pyrinomonadaceae bacterium]
DKVISAAAAKTTDAPGCAVGVSLDGKSIYEKAFGMADLEYSIPNTAQTIFESGSVAKQFTAASIVLLSLEGKLKLDDPVRKYITELPDYGAPLTIRHLLNHTGGVRDWGTVLSLTGFGRGDRVVSQDLAMDVIVHQRGLDFTPGAEYSYSNSGYTLLSTIVERVSKQSLPVFTAERFFKPLGMTHTTWRDDYQRIVPGRAQAYAQQGTGPWRLEMPFMNVYGNGGMLTTVGDWLKWNAMFESRSMGVELVDAMETTGVLNDGRKISYALGISVNTYNGQRQVAHSGSTAGYVTYLARYPGLKMSVAVLCNAASANPTALAHSVVDGVIGPAPAPPQPETVEMSAPDLQKYVSLWRNEKTHLPIRTVVENNAIRVVGGLLLRPTRDGSFAAGPTRWKFESGSNGKPAAVNFTAPEVEERFIAEPAWTPTPEELKAFAGTWHSDEADAKFTFGVEGDKAFFVQRPSTRTPLRPQYKDHFTFGNGSGEVMWFTRSGNITTLHVGTSRMRDMPFSQVSK